MTSYHNAYMGIRSVGDLPAKSRLRCECCKRRATHYGAADGAAMIIGCELKVRRWVKSPVEAHKTVLRMKR